jgi:hypothetical protein
MNKALSFVITAEYMNALDRFSGNKKCGVVSIRRQDPSHYPESGNKYIEKISQKSASHVFVFEVRAVGYSPSFHSRNMIQDRMSQWASVYHHPTLLGSSLSAFCTVPYRMGLLKCSLLEMSIDYRKLIHQLSNGLSFMKNVSFCITKMTAIPFCMHT